MKQPQMVLTQAQEAKLASEIVALARFYGCELAAPVAALVKSHVENVVAGKQTVSLPCKASPRDVVIKFLRAPPGRPTPQGVTDFLCDAYDTDRTHHRTNQALRL